jgi:hypothetical protein
MGDCVCVITCLQVNEAVRHQKSKKTTLRSFIIRTGDAIMNEAARMTLYQEADNLTEAIDTVMGSYDLISQTQDFILRDLTRDRVEEQVDSTWDDYFPEAVSWVPAFIESEITRYVVGFTYEKWSAADTEGVFDFDVDSPLFKPETFIYTRTIVVPVLSFLHAVLSFCLQETCATEQCNGALAYDSQYCTNCWRERYPGNHFAESIESLRARLQQAEAAQAAIKLLPSHLVSERDTPGGDAASNK